SDPFRYGGQRRGSEAREGAMGPAFAGVTCSESGGRGAPTVPPNRRRRRAPRLGKGRWAPAFAGVTSQGWVHVLCGKCPPPLSPPREGGGGRRKRSPVILALHLPAPGFMPRAFSAHHMSPPRKRGPMALSGTAAKMGGLWNSRPPRQPI